MAVRECNWTGTGLNKAEAWEAFMRSWKELTHSKKLGAAACSKAFKTLMYNDVHAP